MITVDSKTIEEEKYMIYVNVPDGATIAIEKLIGVKQIETAHRKYPKGNIPKTKKVSGIILEYISTEKKYKMINKNEFKFSIVNLKFASVIIKWE